MSDNLVRLMAFSDGAEPKPQGSRRPGSPFTAMTSTAMMLFLVGVYLVTAGVSAYELNWWRALYWVCASGLTVAVMMGTK